MLVACFPGVNHNKGVFSIFKGRHWGDLGDLLWHVLSSGSQSTVMELDTVKQRQSFVDSVCVFPVTPHKHESFQL